ncbi:MAG TPA: TRAP transporter small permease [Burkholderiales bacterium]|nr:TRAP transporter small permease [Burkholderiales bacterium]
MRAALELLYKTSGFAAGFFLVAIAVLTAAQITGRLLGLPAYSFDDFAGFSMAASSFLGLAYTLRANEHIRMTLVLHHTRPLARRVLETACLAIAAFLVGLFAWFTCDMTLTSYELNDVSQGLVPVPLWIPQSGIALGLVVLAIAFIDDLIAAVRGQPTSYAAAEAQRAAETPTFER